MRNRRAIYRCVGFIGLVHLLGAGMEARADCPTLEFSGPFPQTFTVPAGCPYMLVKAWGNGGNAGWPTQPVRGKGGGGAALKAVYQVQAGQRFYARVIENYATNAGSHGRAAALHNDSSTGARLFVAAGGGGGGSSNYASQPPDGGAGRGAVGQAGLSATLLHVGQVIVVGPGLGGTEVSGGQGGAGYNGYNGYAGEDYPCDAVHGPSCGQGGASHGGNGGQGHFGGGGGGADGPSFVNGVGGAGGGGGASFVYPDPRLIYEHRYDDGDREKPGNADDPDRQGAGAGAVGEPNCSGCGYAVGVTGRIVVRFNTLEIVPDQTTRWKPQRADEVPIDVVFDSPAELQSAELEITDPNGAPVPVGQQSLRLIASQPLHRYKLTWAGPWVQATGDPLPRGNYSVRVRGTTQGSGVSMRSDAYDEVSLVEVVGVELCRNDQMKTCSDWTTPHENITSANPPVPEIPNQDPIQSRPGGGKRIFSEAGSLEEDIASRVKVRARISPSLPPESPFTNEQLTVPVHFESFDVDDPAPYAPDTDDPTGTVNDNRGDPMAGTITDPEVEVAPGGEYALTYFDTSTSPGDNYRVVASTSRSWLSSVSAKPSSTTGEMNIPDGTGTPVSPMLTVWRTLNLELESMMAPPSLDTDPDSEEYDERNFIKGKVLRLQNSVPPELYVEAEPSNPPLMLSDGSPQLDAAAGRFQNGTIVIGTGTGGVTIANLLGNGGMPPGEFLRLPEGAQIACTLLPPGADTPIQRNIVQLNGALNSLTIDVPVPGWPPYNGGQISIGGLSFLILVASGTAIRVQGPLDLPFVLYDDDAEGHPFSLVSDLVQTSDSPLNNPLAQAYILPRVWDFSTVGEPPPFQRNIRCTSPSGLGEGGCDANSELDAQLALGRNIPPSTYGNWSSYVQGAFQSDQINDGDPRIEWAVNDVYLGMTSSLPDNGSTVYAEAIRDAYADQGTVVIETVKKVTLVHELGHQFGLAEATGNGGGIMGPAWDHHYFNGAQLNIIRGKDSAPLFAGSVASARSNLGTPCDAIDTWKALRPTPLADETALSLSLDRPQYVVGEPLELSLSLKNSGSVDLRGRFEDVHPSSPLLRVDYRRPGRAFEPLDRDRRNFHRAYRTVDLRAGETRSEDMWVSVDRGREALILDEPGTYEFKATFCETPGDSNALVTSNVVTVTVAEAPDGDGDAWRAYSPAVAQFAHWPRAGYRPEDLIEQGLDFVERFPDSPWSAQVRRGLLVDLASLLTAKGEIGDHAALRERYEALKETARSRGDLRKDAP